ncbi:MAG: leucine-rich repeat domain-containing protein [Eubacteriales bacterium]|nr:leucine-rich repeat domain-containing protein [Eubacteriales bacterium]
MRKIGSWIMIILFTALIMIPSLSLAESDYEEGDGWIYQNGELKIIKNNALADFINNEDPVTQLPRYKHTVQDVTTLVIGKDVTDLAIDQAVGDYAPSKTIIEDGNLCFANDNGWIVNKATNTLFGAANIKESQNATVIDNLPSYIEAIGPYAISERRVLIRIDIPAGVKEIQEAAFWLCQSLQTIELPDGLHTLGDRAFADCESLETIHLPTHLIHTGYGTFDRCLNLNSPNISDTRIGRISEDCFGACFKIQILELPESVYCIESIALRICYELHTLIINSENLVIEDEAFYACDKLNRLVFTKGVPSSFGETLFGEQGETPDGKGYISDSSNRRGETIPYPTLYYTAAYAAEWAPNGETEWNGYPIQQISQEELDAILAEARGEEAPAISASFLPTEIPQTETPIPEGSNSKPISDMGAGTILLVAVGLMAIAVVVIAILRSRKEKK